MKNLPKSVVVLCVLVISLSNVVGQKCRGGANCVILKDCNGLYMQLEAGATPALKKLLRELHCGFEGNDPKICCPPEFLPRIGGSTSSSNNNNDFINTNTNNNRLSNSVDATTLLPGKNVCGIQNNDRIVGGTQIGIDEHPWLALLRYDKPRGWGFYCGGVLISPRYILTAAHCVKGSDLPTNWNLSQVRLGEWNTSTSKDCMHDDCSPPVQDIAIEEIIAHESYDAEDKNQHNDIALLRLARNVQYNDFVKPICLPLSNDLKRNTFVGNDVEVAGWGKTETRTESDVKLKVTVPVVSNSQCNNVYSRGQREITSNQLCAGGISGRDSCRGDSGGPLMSQTQSASNWFVIGVVSYGPSPCGTQNWPGVYTRVGAFVDWIVSKLRP